MQGIPAHIPHERRLNWGLQSTVTGLPIYPVPKESVFHRSINQSDEFGLWADFGRWRPPDPIRAQAYLSTLEHTKPRRRTFGQSPNASGTQQSSQQEEERRARPPAPLVHFVGYTKWHMDGRTLTTGELDRLMHQTAQQKYPCSRPATFEEYVSGRIAGLPKVNMSGFDACFVGPGSAVVPQKNGGACHDTLGYRKKVVLTGDDFDGRTTDTGAMWGEKSVVAVVPVERFRKQPSLATFGQLRGLLDNEGRMNLKRSKSWMAQLGPPAQGGGGAGRSTSLSRTATYSDGFKVVDETGQQQLWKSWPRSCDAAKVKNTLNDGRVPGTLPSHGKREPTDQNYPGKSVF